MIVLNVMEREVKERVANAQTRSSATDTNTYARTHCALEQDRMAPRLQSLHGKHKYWITIIIIANKIAIENEKIENTLGMKSKYKLLWYFASWVFDCEIEMLRVLDWKTDASTMHNCNRMDYLCFIYYQLSLVGFVNCHKSHVRYRRMHRRAAATRKTPLAERCNRRTMLPAVVTSTPLHHCTHSLIEYNRVSFE